LSSEELALAFGSAAIAIAAGSVGVFLYSRKLSARTEQKAQLSREASLHQGTTTPDVETPIEDPVEQIHEYADRKSGHRIVPKSELLKSRRELKTLQLERELVSSALTRLYEAEAAQEITRSEREILSTKYRGELQALDERIQKIGALVEIGDLETLRDQLIKLVTQKVDAIDKRLDSTKLIAEPLIAELAKPRPKTSFETNSRTSSGIPDISDLIANPVANASESSSSGQPVVSPPLAAITPSPDNSAGASNPKVVNERQEEALARAPQIESDSEIDSQNNNSKSRANQTNRADELHKEILEALDRLEKLDVDSS
jgi:hypothetical protein